MILAVIISVAVIAFFVITKVRAPKRPNKRGGDIEIPKDDGRYKPDDKESGEPQIK